MRPTSMITYGIGLISLAVIGYGLFWQSLANTLKIKVESELEALEYAIEKRGGQLNYGLITVSGFPTSFAVRIDKFSMRYHKENAWASLALPDAITIRRSINSPLITIQLPKLMQFQTQYATQQYATAYVFESSYEPQVQLELPESEKNTYLDLDAAMPNWAQIEAALTHFKLSTRDSNLSIQTGNTTLVYQHVDTLSFDYQRTPIEDNPKDQYQFKISMNGYMIQDAIDARWLTTLPYYRFLSHYFRNSQPLQAQCDLVIIGPKELSNFYYQDSSYQINQCEVQNQLGKINLSSQFALFQSKQSPRKGNVQIDISNYLAMATPLLNSVESTLALPILQGYTPTSTGKPQAPLEEYQRLFVSNFSELGNESDNGKNFSISMQFEDNKVLIKNDSLQNKLPPVLHPLKAIQEMQQLFQQSRPTTQAVPDKSI